MTCQHICTNTNHIFPYIYKWLFSFQNNYIFTWGNSWTKDLIVDPNTRPYGFPPALWVALHKGTTMVPAYECDDPLCRWMFMSCTPDHTLSIQWLPGSNGQADWRISSLTDGYIDGVNKTRRVRDPPPKPVRNKIAGRFMDYDFYTRMEKRNATLAEKKREERRQKKSKTSPNNDTNDTELCEMHGASVSGI